MKQLPVITLRAMEPEDLEVLYTIENDRSLWDMGTSNVPYSRYSLRDYIVHASNDIYVDRQVRLVIENSEHQVVGLADLANFDPQHLRAELGLVVRKQYRNMGYGNQIVEKMIEYAHEVINIQQLYVVVDTDNTASIELFKNNGFSVSHCLKEWLFDGEKYRNAVFLTLFL